MNDQSSKKIVFNKSTLLSLKAELLKKQEEVQEKKKLPQNKIENFSPAVVTSDKYEREPRRTDKKTLRDNLKANDTEDLEAHRKAKLALEMKAELYEHLSDTTGNSQLSSRFLVDFSTKKKQEVAQNKDRESSPESDKVEEEHYEEEDEDSEWSKYTDCLGRTRRVLKADIEHFIKRDKELSKAMRIEVVQEDDKDKSDDERVKSEDDEVPFPTFDQGRSKAGVPKPDELTGCTTTDLACQGLYDPSAPRAHLFATSHNRRNWFYDLSTARLVSYRAVGPQLKKPFETLGKDSERRRVKEKPFLVQRTNDYLQSLRDKWEQKEQELLAKQDKDIHYQDVLFDEARQHGVSYYSFSTDEEERRKQMEQLQKQRQETLKSQKEAEEKRKKREELIAARVKAARARQRLRAGLPPEEPEPKKDFSTCLLEFLEQQKNEADAKAKEKEKKLREEQEIERQKLREVYVREWDIGKEGVHEKIKKFKEMTQEEYVEQQRAKRIEEFAPPQACSSKSDFSFDDGGKMVANDEKLVEKTWASVRPQPKTPPPPDFNEFKGLYFSSKQHKEVKYKNFVKEDEINEPIRNELSDEEIEAIKDNKRKPESNNSEIAPPPTYDYYGPVPKHKKLKAPFSSDMREAFDQGMKSLESRDSNRKVSEYYDFM